MSAGGDRKSPALAGAEALLLKFVAHHLWDPQRHETDLQHGMPGEVEQVWRDGGFLKSLGPHAPIPRAGGWPTGRR